MLNDNLDFNSMLKLENDQDIFKLPKISEHKYVDQTNNFAEKSWLQKS